MRMPDREKVIKGLEVVRNAIVDGYIHEPDRAVNAITDAIAMLKEQQKLVDEITKRRANNKLADTIKEVVMEDFFALCAGKPRTSEGRFLCDVLRAGKPYLMPELGKGAKQND